MKKANCLPDEIKIIILRDLQADPGRIGKILRDLPAVRERALTEGHGSIRTTILRDLQADPGRIGKILPGLKADPAQALM